MLGYLMLTGVLPFDAHSFGAIAKKHITEPHVPVRELAPSAPADLCAAIEKCLKKEPENRWRRAGDLASELTRAPNRLTAISLVSRLGRSVAMVAAAAWMSVGK